MKHFFLFATVLFFLSCGKKSSNEPTTTSPNVTVDPSEALLAGAASIGDNSGNAYTFQAPNIGSGSLLDFAAGNSFFRDSWVIAPSSTSGRDGLGPMFNASSCTGCHALNGRGRPLDGSLSPTAALLFRLSILGMDSTGAPNPDPHYGGQFQPKAIPFAKPEGEVRISYSEVPGHYADGSSYSLQVPTYTFDSLQFGPMDASVLFSPRIAQQMPGLGLLEAVSEQTILAYSDPSDGDGDGISGRPNYVWDVEAKAKKLGRFGWKANQPSLRQQSAGALNGDVGITSSLFPSEGLTVDQKALFNGIPNGGNPEISDVNLAQLTYFCATLAVPVRRNISNPDVIQGKALFSQIGCDKCHLTELKTGEYQIEPAFSNMILHPYTDMLLHDMGSGLADNRPDYEADGNEWRTPPLWGIGMIQIVNKHNFLLHDGRARGFEEAILWHGGEGEKAMQEFVKLNATQRKQLVTFLENL